MPSHSEKYEASRLRHIENKMLLSEFKKTKEFPLDHFQIDACKALESGNSVLVAAPTGSGKTVVGEFAIFLAQHNKGKAFYTTPIKALSNQKFHELIEIYGEAGVGLLTGDVSINGDAPIVVMTTEVLRNMLYVQSSTLIGLMHVIMDEVHYLADRSRGAVWEEVILHLPPSVQITALSATVSNIEEFGAWLTSVRGETSVVLEEHRPVPLWQWVAADKEIHDLFIDETGHRINPALINIFRDDQRQLKGVRGRQRYSRHTPFKERLIQDMDREGLLPAIWFIFSRKGCDQAVEHCLNSNVKLTNPEEREQISRFIQSRTNDLPNDDLAALNFGNWAEALGRGIAAHHAGLIPRFKEIIEELFQRGLVKLVFATETLALGINMPARSVVIEKLSKWNGESHVSLTAGEYTQLTGRAGRRGIDDEGNSIVLWHENFDPLVLGGLASTRTYPLKSSFRPGYNMAVNVIDALGFERTETLLNESFAQFQSDAGSAGLLTSKRKNEEALAGYADAMTCHLGDFMEYSAIRNRISDIEKGTVRNNRLLTNNAIEDVMRNLQIGDVILAQHGRRSGPVVVIENLSDAQNEPRLMTMNLEKEVRRMRRADFVKEIEVIGKIKLAANFHARSASSKNELLQKLKKIPISNAKAHKNNTFDSAVEVEIATLRLEMRNHPCHGCNDREEHARWSERYFRLMRDNSFLEEQLRKRSNIIAKDFENVCDVLLKLGYLSGERPNLKTTAIGKQLKGIHAESTLLISESLRAGMLEELNAAELAAVVSVFVYESRKEESDGLRMNNPNVVHATSEIMKQFQELRTLELTHKLSTITKPDPGFAALIYNWANGNNLLQVLKRTEISAGDFVRTTRRIIDVLEQISHVGNEHIRKTALDAVYDLRRGIVSASELED
ncbi:MAG: DEAD/DEAH box helicase [Actinobacteria bacterium]|nr:DEAD/DEAH box helicase [Actinomycetota bacterium]